MADCVNTDYKQLEAGLLLEYQFLSPGAFTVYLEPFDHYVGWLNK